MRALGCAKRIVVVLWAVLMVSNVAAQISKQNSKDVEQRVDTLLGKLTLEEKLQVLGGDRSFYIHALPSIGMPAIKMSDGPYGVRTFGAATAYAAGVSLAAAWDPQMAQAAGRSLARDAKARGVGILLAPGVNIYRSPLNGRNFEYFGEDPYLTSRIAVGFIQGLQSEGVVATVKHFAANNSEYDRHNLNAIVDERTLREIYLPAFEASVREAKVGAVMDSYNLLNGERLTQSDQMNNQLLKQEWKFDGIVMSDWGATASTLPSAKGGLDLEMPNGHYMNPDSLRAELAKGTLSMATIDDKVRRILRIAVRFGFLDKQQWDPGLSEFDSGGDEVSYQAALASITLLKNDGDVLPLSPANLKTVAVIGPDADPPATGGGGSSMVTPQQYTSLMQALKQKLGNKANILYSRGVIRPTDMFSQMHFDAMTKNIYETETCTGKPIRSAPATRIADYRTSIYSLANLPVAEDRRCEEWIGTYEAPVTGSYTVLAAAVLRDVYDVKVGEKTVLHQSKSEDQSPNSAEMFLHGGDRVEIRVRYLPDAEADRLGVAIAPTSHLIAPEVDTIARNADAVIVAAGFGPESEGESHDRTFTLPYGQAELIRRIACDNPHTIVTVASGGGYETASWLDHVPALLQDWYFGQEGGRALADILLGHSPEGKLPMTFERRLEDNPTMKSYYPDPSLKPTPSVRYSEGLFVGYRYYTSRQKSTLFPFGYGLSYTSFRLDHLKVSGSTDAKNPMVSVEFDVTNIGDREGTEIPQVYVGENSPTVSRPLRELKGFSKVRLKPGETKHVSLSLSDRAFAYFDINGHTWKTDQGKYTIEVGTSSEQIVLRAPITLN
jgi:beta-glucosidase